MMQMPMKEAPMAPVARAAIALTPPPGAAAAAPVPRLVVLRDDGSEGASFALGVDVVDLGRSEGDILLHDDLYVSPRHARIRREGDRVRVIDLASTNGIYLRLRGPHRLSTGNLILLGLEVLQFQLVKDAETSASPHAPIASAPRPRAAHAAPGRPGAGGGYGTGGAGGRELDVEATWTGGGRAPAAGAPGFLGQASQHGTLVFGSPAAPRRASLHQRTVEGIVRDVHHLVRDEVILGREGADIVFSADPYMSRRHAVIRRDPASDVYTLTDLDSSNGTFVRIENDAYLGDGDEIRVGRHLFRFESGGGSGGDMLSGRARAGSA
jgi:pSer/pThr/pTyr-binding forkhead associated (FHA) protein